MKKFLTLLTACLLLVLTASTAMAATVDLSYVRSNPDIFTIDPSSDGSAYFVETVLTAKDRHFTHKYESDYYWSSTQFDVLVLGIDSNDQYPVWRCWVIYANDTSFKKIDSVTFVLGGKRYTFTDIDDPENWYTQNETSYLEEMLIKFGMDNLEFVVALEEYCNSLESVDDFQCTLILHAANEDITVTLGSGFALDFMLTKKAYLEMDGLSTIDRVISTEMTVR